MNKQAIKFLRGVSHNLNPVVMVADKGLTENVMTEIETALDKHELIKIKIRMDRETRSEYIEQIVTQTGAEKVHTIGQILTVFRRNPKQPQFELPQ